MCFICFEGIQCGTGASFFSFLVQPISFPHGHIFFSAKSQFNCSGNLCFRGQFPCLGHPFIHYLLVIYPIHYPLSSMPSTTHLSSMPSTTHLTSMPSTTYSIICSLAASSLSHKAGICKSIWLLLSIPSTFIHYSTGHRFINCNLFIQYLTVFYSSTIQSVSQPSITNSIIHSSTIQLVIHSSSTHCATQPLLPSTIHPVSTVPPSHYLPSTIHPLPTGLPVIHHPNSHLFITLWCHHYPPVRNATRVDTWIHYSLKYRNKQKDKQRVQSLHLVRLQTAKETLSGKKQTNKTKKKTPRRKTFEVTHIYNETVQFIASYIFKMASFQFSVHLFVCFDQTRTCCRKTKPSSLFLLMPLWH